MCTWRLCTWVDVYLVAGYLCMYVYLMGMYQVGVLPGVQGCPQAHLPAPGHPVPGLYHTALFVVKRRNLLALLLLSWLNPLGICPEAALAREGDHVWVCPRDLSQGRAVLALLHTPQACIILTVL